MSITSYMTRRFCLSYIVLVISGRAFFAKLIYDWRRLRHDIKLDLGRDIKPVIKVDVFHQVVREDGVGFVLSYDASGYVARPRKTAETRVEVLPIKTQQQNLY